MILRRTAARRSFFSRWSANGSGRAPAPPSINWPGAPRQGARHACDSTDCCRSRPLTTNSSKSSCYARPDHTIGVKPEKTQSEQMLSALLPLDDKQADVVDRPLRANGRHSGRPGGLPHTRESESSRVRVVCRPWSIRFGGCSPILRATVGNAVFDSSAHNMKSLTEICSSVTLRNVIWFSAPG
jgi:hypothetical protein